MELFKIPTKEEIKAKRKAEIERLEQERRIEMQKTVLIKIPSKEEIKAKEKAKKEEFDFGMYKYDQNHYLKFLQKDLNHLK